MNIYVGNLSYSVSDNDLLGEFSKFGAVKSAKVITDMNSGRSKGFGFVEMDSSADAQRAIAELNGKELDGRALVVNEARPKPAGGGDRRPPRGPRY